MERRRTVAVGSAGVAVAYLCWCWWLGLGGWVDGGVKSSSLPFSLFFRRSASGGGGGWVAAGLVGEIRYRGPKVDFCTTHP